MVQTRPKKKPEAISTGERECICRSSKAEQNYLKQALQSQPVLTCFHLLLTLDHTIQTNVIANKIQPFYLKFNHKLFHAAIETILATFSRSCSHGEQLKRTKERPVPDMDFLVYFKIEMIHFGSSPKPGGGGRRGTTT